MVIFAFTAAATSSAEEITGDWLQQQIDSIQGKVKQPIMTDWLIIGCYTGQHVSDLLKLTPDNVTVRNGLELIELTQIKTGKRVAIPLHPKVKAILEKRDGNFPYYISDVKFNVHIKDVCKLAGIDEPTKGTVLTDLDEGKEAIKQEDHRWRNVSGTYLNMN